MRLNYPELVQGSGWFDCTEPPLATYLEEKQGVQGAFALVRGSSSTSNHPEPMLKNSTHFAISARRWFEKVRGGSMRLNYPEWVRGGSTVPNLLYLHI